MNRTLIALVAVSLGALLPAPAQGTATEHCLSTLTDDTMLDVGVETKEFCVAASACEPGSYGAGVNGQSKCLSTENAPDCVPEASPSSTTAYTADCPIDPCPDGEVGIRVGRVGSCGSSHYQIPDCAPEFVALMVASGNCPVATSNPPPPGEDCKKTEDDNGMGGTHVDCQYDCMVGDELGIYAEAHDKTWGKAEADGSTSCGGTTADCDIQSADKTICTGLSGIPATRNEQGMDCHGESHEAFDDKVTVACYSAGVSTVCKALPSLPECDPRWSVTPQSTLSNQAIATCIANLPLVLSSEPAASGATRLLQTLPLRSLGSFTAFEFDANSGLAIGATISNGPVTCWAQWL